MERDKLEEYLMNLPQEEYERVCVLYVGYSEEGDGFLDKSSVDGCYRGLLKNITLQQEINPRFLRRITRKRDEVGGLEEGSFN